jgi:hypothetical protein
MSLSKTQPCEIWAARDEDLCSFALVFSIKSKVCHVLLLHRSLSLYTFREHLYRCHKAPRNYCERCFHSFSALSDLEFHRMSITDCASRAVEPPEAITPAVEIVLKSRKKAYPNQTEEDRWKCVYRILFPDEPVPNPCKFGVIISATQIPNHTKQTLSSSKKNLHTCSANTKNTADKNCQNFSNPCSKTTLPPSSPAAKLGKTSW